MSDVALTNENLISQLLTTVPEFEPVYQEHLGFTGGEVLDCVLLGDFTRFLFSSYRVSISSSDDAGRWRGVVVRSLDLMERAAKSEDWLLRNLIGGCFVENLLPSDKEYEAVYRAIKLMLGPKLHEWLLLLDPPG